MNKNKGIIVELTDGRKGIALYSDQKGYAEKNKLFIRLIDEELNPIQKENGLPAVVVKSEKEINQIGWLD